MSSKFTQLTPPKFTLFDVRYATDESIVARAEKLHQGGKVKLTACDERGYFAVVQGTHPYNVWLSQQALDRGDCDCYMGQQAQFCKHLLALALKVLDETGVLTAADESMTESEAKAQIAGGARKFTAYNGPSRVWFAYQQRLAVGAGMIQEALPFLPSNKNTITFLWNLVIRLSRKLSHGGIDDSDGTVGSCIDEINVYIAKIAKEDPIFLQHARTHCIDETGFGFEEDLQKLLV